MSAPAQAKVAFHKPTFGWKVIFLYQIVLWVYLMKQVNKNTFITAYMLTGCDDCHGDK